MFFQFNLLKILDIMYAISFRLYPFDTFCAL